MTYGEVPSDNGGVDKGSGFSLLISKSLRANDIGVVVTGAPYTNRNDGLVTNNGIVSSLKVPMKVDEVSKPHIIHLGASVAFDRCASLFSTINVQFIDFLFVTFACVRPGGLREQLPLVLRGQDHPRGCQDDRLAHDAEEVRDRRPGRGKHATHDMKLDSSQKNRS